MARSGVLSTRDSAFRSLLFYKNVKLTASTSRQHTTWEVFQYGAHRVRICYIFIRTTSTTSVDVCCSNVFIHGLAVVGKGHFHMHDYSTHLFTQMENIV